MDNKDIVNKNDFIELKYTGYANDEIFDSNYIEDLKKINPKASPIKTIIAVGQEMVLKGLDDSLVNKEVGKEYNITLTPKESFGERKRELIKTLPLKAFTEKKVNPYPGLILTLDDFIVKIIASSGGRVIADFNNPLAGKIIKYKFTIMRKVYDEKEKIDALFLIFIKLIPKYEIKDNIVIKGTKEMDFFVKIYSQKFKELVGKPLILENIKQEDKQKEKIKENSQDNEHHEHNHTHNNK